MCCVCVRVVACLCVIVAHCVIVASDLQNWQTFFARTSNIIRTDVCPKQIEDGLTAFKGNHGKFPPRLFLLLWCLLFVCGLCSVVFVAYGELLEKGL